MRNWPIRVYSFAKLEMERPLVHTLMMPLMQYCVPSVRIKPGSLNFTMHTPFIKPISRPTASASRIATGMLHPALSALPQTTPPMLVAAPRDRSMPPAQSRKVTGTAIMIQKDAVRRTSIKLLRTKKFSLTKPTMTIRMISGMAAPASFCDKTILKTFFFELLGMCSFPLLQE